MTTEDREKKAHFQQQLCDLMATALADELCPGCLAQALVKTSLAVCKIAALTPEEPAGHGFGLLAVASDITPSPVTSQPPGAPSRH